MWIPAYGYLYGKYDIYTGWFNLGMKKIQVALCITELDWGGAERCLVRLARGMDRERFEPTVYCLASRPSGGQNCIAPLEEAGIATHCLGAASKFHFLRTVRRLARLLRRNRTDVVQSFLFHANVISAWAAHRAGVRPFLAGIRVAEHRRQFPIFTERPFDRWIDTYVCVSQSVADFYHARTGVHRNKLLVIPNGIDPGPYLASPDPKREVAGFKEMGIGGNRRLVCFVGRLEPQKGVDWLLNSADRWLGELPDHDLLIVGAGAERSVLERIAAAKHIDHRVHFAGWRGDVPDILARSEILVLPSAWEGMPNVVLEAMASALPVVACDVEGVSELLGNLSGPQMIAHGDTDALVEKIVALGRNPTFAREIGQKNRFRIEQNFSLSKMIRAYENLWESHLRR